MNICYLLMFIGTSILALTPPADLPLVSSTLYATPAEEKIALEIKKLRMEVEALSRPSPTFWAHLKENWKTTVIALIAAAFAIFPNYLIEQIRSGLNRADERFVQFRQLSEDLGEHTFNAEVLETYYRNDWTTKEGLTPIVNDYNRSITTLRKREHLYRAVLDRYWSAVALTEFEMLMKNIKQLDATIHELNPEAEKVANEIQTKANPEVVAPILSKLQSQIERLRQHTSTFLTSLLK